MFSFFKKFSLKQKLISFLLLLYIICVISQLWITSYYFRNAIVDKTKDYFTGAISQVGARIDGYIESYNQFASLISNNATTGYYLDDINHKRKSYSMLASLIKSDVIKLKQLTTTDISDLYIFPLQGNPINCFYTTEVLDETDLYSSMILNRLKDIPDNKTIWDDMYSEKDYISSYSPIMVSGSVVGLLRIRYEKRFFGDIIDNINLNPGNTVLITDGMNNVIYSNEDSLIGKNRRNIDIEDSFLIETPLKNTGWNIIGIISNASAFGEITKLNIISLVLNGIILVFIAVALLLYTNRVLHPLKDILFGIKQVQNGNLSVKLISDNENNSEFGFIARNFNQMVERINSLINEVYKYQIATRQADIAALEAKLNPHFLYNTLDTIYWILIMKGNAYEADMVTKVTDILRYSLSHQDEFVSLWEDIAQIENYIVLQQCRFSDKFKYSISIADDIRDIKIPKLLLQPLIENTFKHGFSDFSKTGYIKISGFSKGGDILLIVEDNGAGIPPERFPSIFSSGFGLRVTRDRIAYAYGDECGIEIHSKPYEGTKIVIRILRQPKISLTDVSEES